MLLRKISWQLLSRGLMVLAETKLMMIKNIVIGDELANFAIDEIFKNIGHNV